MRNTLFVRLLLAASLTHLAAQAQTAPQAPAPSAHTIGYGAPISLSDAKRVSAAAMAEAARMGVPMAIAITDASGMLVYLEKQDNAILAGVTVAQDKARSAAVFKRPTKAFEDVIAGGGSGNRVLGLAGAVPVEGGLPIVAEGKVIGAIGASGGTGAQDGQVAKAGLDGLK